MKIGILTSGNNDLLIKTIKERGHSHLILNPKKCYQYISENDRGVDRLYYGETGEQPTRIQPGMMDAIIPRIGSNVEYSAALLRFITENLGVYCPSNSWGLVYASNKSWTLQRLSNAGIRIPRTIVAESPAHVKWCIEKVGSLPVILKTNQGSLGKTVAIIETKKTANSVLEFALNSNLKVLIEEYIEGGASDYRVWVIDGKVVVAMKRTSTDKEDFKANISRGGKGEKVILDKSDETLCIKAAAALGLGIAGVDLMKSEKTGKSYIIEVNANPGTKVIGLTGVNVWQSVIDMLESNYKTENTNSMTSALTEAAIFNQSNLLSNYVDLTVKNGQLQDQVNRLKSEKSRL